MHLEANRESEVSVQNGWLMLSLAIAFVVINLGLLIAQAVRGPLLLLFIVDIVLVVFLIPGFFSLQPNEARVLVLFGAYKGTVRKSGFHWGNPFYSNGPQGMQTSRKRQNASQGETPTGARMLGRYKISLRARTLNGERLKVNDRRGNPVEIGAVVVWRVA